jgi:hypothetical protein
MTKMLAKVKDGLGFSTSKLVDHDSVIEHEPSITIAGIGYQLRPKLFFVLFDLSSC